MCHTDMEGRTEPACPRHWAKTSGPDIPILVKPGAHDRLHLMGVNVVEDISITKSLPDLSISGFLLSNFLLIDI